MLNKQLNGSNYTLPVRYNTQLPWLWLHVPPESTHTHTRKYICIYVTHTQASVGNIDYRSLREPSQPFCAVAIVTGCLLQLNECWSGPVSKGQENKLSPTGTEDEHFSKGAASAATRGQVQDNMWTVVKSQFIQTPNKYFLTSLLWHLVCSDGMEKWYFE